MSSGSGKYVGGIVLPPSANFVPMVRFTNISDTYVIGSDISCAYTIHGTHEVNSRDWVGIYKVGWRTSSEYLYYEWSPVPANYVKGVEATSHITFPGVKLPRDDCEFYQFCYVAACGLVRGTSPPFQFKPMMVDDLVEVEDESGELLVVRTKTAVLEDQLKKANEVRTDLKQKILILENEQSLMVVNLKRLEKERDKAEERSRSLTDELKESNDKMADLHHEVEDLQGCVHSLQEKIEVLNQEKLSMEKRLDESDVYIVSLQEKIKNLVTDKDSLAGRARALEEEKLQCETRAADSDNHLKLLMTELERNRDSLAESMAGWVAMKKRVINLEQELGEQKNKSKQQAALSNKEKERLADLQENLHNAEDKLQAAEMCKTLLNEEVIATRQTLEKMSSDLERAKAEADTGRSHVTQLEVKLSHIVKESETKIDSLSQLVAKRTEEISSLSTLVTELRQLIDEKTKAAAVEESGAMYALQEAQTKLKERYSKVCDTNKQLEAKVQQMELKVRMLENDVNNQERIMSDQQKEISSLKNRLYLGQEEYKKIYIERERLLAKLQHHKDGAVKSVASPAELSPSEITTDDLLQQIQLLGDELQKRKSSIDKYKKKYRAAKQELDKQHQNSSSYEAVAGVNSSPSSTALESFDPLRDADGTAQNLDAVLKPLPPPMQPQILPSAKVAQVKAAINVPLSPAHTKSLTAADRIDMIISEVIRGSDRDGTSPVVIKRPGGTEEIIDLPGLESDDLSVAEEDRFVDAPTEPQTARAEEDMTCYRDEIICPVCSLHMSQRGGFPPFEVASHVNSHFDD